LKAALLRNYVEANNLQENLKLARERLGVITAIIGEVVGGVLAIFFYFTFLVPFAAIARFTTDPLHRADDSDPTWLSRDPVSTELDRAKRQG
jgi:hypothetical protein